jgi:UDP-2-acetamido-2,6-beta-L-arabino-hexul-4-ose reductase
MKILVTGSNGFLGKHIVLRLEELGHKVLTYGRNDNDLDNKISNSEFIFHLAGVNRTENESDFQKVNVGLTQAIVKAIKNFNVKVPIIFASSYQATQLNPYGISKKKAEDELLEFNLVTGNLINIFRLPGIFGKWSKPYYNTVVATFVDQVLNEKPLTIHDPQTIIEIAYIDDVVNDMVECIQLNNEKIYQDVKKTHKLTLKDLTLILQSFKENEAKNLVPTLEDEFTKKLYSTYVSFKTKNQFKTKLTSHSDHRGSFTEILKQTAFGQISVNMTKPGIEKGHHYHHHKHEKFLVVSGKAQIQLKKLFTDEFITINVSEETLEVVDIPPGYVHSIKNIGDKDLVTLMWANEIFDPENPDTISKKV